MKPIQELTLEYGLGSTVHLVPPVAPNLTFHFYQRCAALFQVRPPSPWGGAINQALACGRPVVATEDALTAALVGPAGYLAPADQPRLLGAALITVIVEESVGESLSKAAHQRAAGWDSSRFTRCLLEAYQAPFS
jgi:glycosyltransferase involved in cell wall biosynthesis